MSVLERYIRNSANVIISGPQQSSKYYYLKTVCSHLENTNL